MAPVFQVKKSPHLIITSENDMTASTTVTTIGPPLGNEFLPAEMG
jgi:hypothetical protein